MNQTFGAIALLIILYLNSNIILHANILKYLKYTSIAFVEFDRLVLTINRSIHAGKGWVSVSTGIYRRNF